MSRFLYLYIADFPAWTKLRHDASLRGKPLVICSGGRIVAASTEAYATGIKLGWSLPRAQAIETELITAALDTSEVLIAWEEVLSRLYTMTPCIESVRPGLAFADIAIPGAVRAAVAEWRARAGIADDRTTAEIAALTTRPGVVRCIKPSRSISFLNTTDIGILEEIGVSSETIQHCRWFGWDKIAHLRAATLQQLTSRFSEGALLFRYAQAKETRRVAVYRPPQELTAHCSFDEALTEPSEWEPALRILIEEVCNQLDGRIAHALCIRVETKGRTQQSHRLLREGTGNARMLHVLARRLMSDLAGGSIDRIEIGLASLTLHAPVQASLFRPVRPSLNTVMRALEARFPGRAKRVVMLDPNAYLPERTFHLEPLRLDEKTTGAAPVKRKTKPAPTYKKRGSKARLQEEQLVMR